MLNKNTAYTLTDGVNLSATRIASTVYKSDGSLVLGYEWTALSHASTTIPNMDDLGYLVYLRINNNAVTSNTVFKPMIRLSTVTDATFEPYSNICHISGHTQAVVTRTGKNLVNIQGKTITAADGEYWFYGTEIDPIPAGTYTISFKGIVEGTTNYKFVGHDADGNEVVAGGSTVPHKYTFTTNKTMKKIRMYVNGPGTFSDFQIEIGSAATAYEPYQGQSVTIDLNGTRYGGTLDVGTGVMTVTHTYVDVNAFGSVTSVTSAGGLHWVDTTTAVFDADKSSYCSMLTRKDGNAGWLSTSPCYAMDTNNKIRIYCNESTTALFKSAYADVQIVYGLLNSTTVQLSHTEVRTLSGYNNIWSNTGDTNVIYESSQVDSTNNYNVGIWMNCYD